MTTPRHIWQIAGACILACLLAACGSSGTTSPPKATPTPTPAATTSSPATSAASATIAANWEKFFDAKTPVSERISLLQDGSQFPSSALAATGLAAGASAKVLSVSNVTSSSATVTYDILLDGSVALAKQKGTAVYEDGTWKVGVASFCGLLTLEAGGSTSKLPPVCTS